VADSEHRDKLQDEAGAQGAQPVAIVRLTSPFSLDIARTSLDYR
jgi:hypothetical protein